jgi:hypothetical protein
MLHPGDCSPSRSVVSKMYTRSLMLPPALWDSLSAAACFSDAESLWLLSLPGSDFANL